MPEVVKQVGFCLVCGGSIHSDQPFYESDNGCCHKKCVEKKRP
ncbi:MAG: hypothetical protein ABEK04_02470 [Candidatus Nanohalobium sp.]